MDLSAEEYAKLQSQIPYFDSNPEYQYLAGKKLLPQQRGIESFENAPFLTGLRRSLFGMTKSEQQLADQQQQALVPFQQEQLIKNKVMAEAGAQMALAPPLESMQANFPSILPTKDQLQIAEGPRPTGPGFLEVPAEGPGLPQQRDLLGTDAFLRTLSPQEMSQGRFQQELNQRGPGAYQEGLRPTTLQPTGADVELYGPGAPINRQIPGVKPNMAQLGAYQSLLAGHTADDRSSLKPPALVAEQDRTRMMGNQPQSDMGKLIFDMRNAKSEGEAQTIQKQIEAKRTTERVQAVQETLKALGIPEGSEKWNQTFDNLRSTLSTHQPATTQEVKIDNYMPASQEAQRDFMKSTRATYDQLKQVPVQLDNIEKAKALIPSAKGFMGPAGESLLEAAKFLNNRMGTNIDTKGIQSAEELRSRIFFNIIDNLKKMDSQPSQLQQVTMQDSLGKLGTDPNALADILDAYGDSLSGKVELHNQEVAGATKRGVKFPYDPTIVLKSNAPEAGTVKKGFKFKGGDPTKRENWEPVR